MSNPIDQNYTFYRGEDVRIRFTMTPKTDISAYDLGFWLKTSVDDADAAALVTLGTSDLLHDGPNGIIDVNLTSAQSQLSAKTYYYAVWRKTTNARLAGGTITISKSARLFA